MNEEIWKDIEGYEGVYQVSTLGNVRRLKGKNCLNDRLRRMNIVRGYHHVLLSKNAVHVGYQVHRLVALAFIPNPENKPVVNHKDSDRANNNVDNLEWSTQQENVRHSFIEGFRTGIRGEDNANSKISSGAALTIRFMCKELGFFQRELAKEFGLCQQRVSKIVNNEAWAL